MTGFLAAPQSEDEEPQVLLAQGHECQTEVALDGSFQKLGAPFLGVPHNKAHSVLGSSLGLPISLKAPGSFHTPTTSLHHKCPKS